MPLGRERNESSTERKDSHWTMTMNLNLQIKGAIFVCGFVLSRRGTLLLTTRTH